MQLHKIAKIIFLAGLVSVNAIGHATTPATAVNDTAITTKVKAQIALNKNLSVFHVGVRTTNGIVHLQGKLASETQASTLVQIAESTSGVKDVDTSYLLVKNSNQPFTDSFITAKVKGRFAQEKLFGQHDVSLTSISVETKDGVVFLQGIAPTEEDIQTAISIAKMVNGVKEVKSELTVGGSATS